jgi:hypothetical protein
MATAATPAPAYYSVAEVLTILGIAERTFRTHYLRRFTDTRPVEKRVRRVPHRIRRSEVELVVERGWEALAQTRSAAA